MLFSRLLLTALSWWRWDTTPIQTQALKKRYHKIIMQKYWSTRSERLLKYLLIIKHVCNSKPDPNLNQLPYTNMSACNNKILAPPLCTTDISLSKRNYLCRTIHYELWTLIQISNNSVQIKLCSFYQKVSFNTTKYHLTANRLWNISYFICYFGKKKRCQWICNPILTLTLAIYCSRRVPGDHGMAGCSEQLAFLAIRLPGPPSWIMAAAAYVTVRTASIR